MRTQSSRSISELKVMDRRSFISNVPQKGKLGVRLCRSFIPKRDLYHLMALSIWGKSRCSAFANLRMSFFLSLSKVETWTLSVSFAIWRNLSDCLWRLAGQTSNGSCESSVEDISFFKQKRSSLAVTSSRDRIATGARSARFNPWPQFGKPWLRKNTAKNYVFKNFGGKIWENECTVSTKQRKSSWIVWWR